MAEFPVNITGNSSFFCNIDKLETPNFGSAGRMAKLTVEYPVTEYYVILTWKVPQDVFSSGEQNANCRTIVFSHSLMQKQTLKTMPFYCGTNLSM